MSYLVLRNKKTGAYLSRMNYGVRPPEPIDSDDYHPPMLFVEHGFDMACGVMAIDWSVYEKVGINFQEEFDG